MLMNSFGHDKFIIQISKGHGFESKRYQPICCKGRIDV